MTDLKKYRVLHFVRPVKAWDLAAIDWEGKAGEMVRLAPRKHKLRQEGPGRSLYDNVWTNGARSCPEHHVEHGLCAVRLGRVGATDRGPHGFTRWICGELMLEIVTVEQVLPKKEA